MREILLSVIIPTYNRYKYLRGCLESLSRLKSDQVEIIVQDNTENNIEIVNFISILNDKRIKYYHIKEHICVGDNCDEAMKHVTGKYVCMIGDDDTICDTMVNAAQYCLENSIDAVKFYFPGFNWPDMIFQGKKKEANLFFKEKADGSITFINAKEVLLRAIKKADGVDLMPRVYHGMVSKECLDRIYEKAGSYFPGPSPDMGNAAAVCLESKKSAYISDYLMVSGYGYTSARGEGNRQQHYGKLDEKPWLPSDIIERWDNNIPKIFSGETIIADSFTESLRRMGREDLRKKYNYSYLYAMFIWHHKDAKDQFINFLNENPIRWIKIIKGVVARAGISLRYRLFHNEIPNFMEREDVVNLLEAQDIVYAIRKELSIRDYFVKDRV